MSIQIIKSYLVELGFEVDNHQLRQFRDALRRMASEVERYTTSPLSGIAGMFLKTGATIAGVLTSIAGGTALMADKVAAADLDFQVLARRMFVGTQVAKQMKIATDALGYSLEDIIWGPPELRERYGQLQKDQQRMTSGLGPDWERQMRSIRDVRFEFTRLGVEAQYFAMNLAGAVSRGLFGEKDPVKKLKEMNRWFQDNMSGISKFLADKLVPLMSTLGDIADEVFTKKNAEWVINVTGEGLTDLKILIEWLKNPKKARALLGDTVGGALEDISDLTTANAAQRRAFQAMDPNWRSAKQTRSDLEESAYWAARHAGVDPDQFKALIGSESSWNPNARNVSKYGVASGLSQLMQYNMNNYGLNGADPDQNLEIGARLFAQYLKESRGNLNQAVAAYKGHKKTDPNADLQGYHKWLDMYTAPQAKVRPQSYQNKGAPQVHIGSVTVHAAPGQSPEEISNAVIKKISEKEDWAVQRMMMQQGVSYA